MNGVQKSPRNICTLPLSTRGLRVLELLGAGNTASQTARTLGIGRSSVSYWVKKLLKMGLIQIQVKDVVKIYRLTYQGSKILTRSERGSRVVVLEDYPIKYEVFEDEKVPVDWVKLGRPRNWEKLGFKIGGVRVIKTSRSVIVHPGQIRGDDPYELLYLSGRLCDRVAGYLESSLGMRLGPGEPIRKPIFQIYDGLASSGKFHAVKVPGVGGEDNSPPSLEPHHEFEGPEETADFLLMPKRLKKLERDMDILNQDVLYNREEQRRRIEQRLDVLEKGQVTHGQLLRAISNSLIMLNSNFERFLEQQREILKELKRRVASDA